MPVNPFSGKEINVSLGNLQSEMNQLFDRLWHAGVSTGPFDGQEWAPLVDLYERPESFVAFVEVAGVDSSSIDLTCLERSLTIRGTKSTPSSSDESLRPVRTERRYGTFCRTLDLPADVTAEKISARCQGGVVEITIPKAQAGIPKRIQVEAGE